MPDSPAQPRLSATVLLVRDGAELEVLMVARHYEIDFAAGALVFPGGKCSGDDARPEWSAEVDGDYDGVDLTARIGAAREAFEETGILLARPKSARGPGAPLVGEEVCEALAPFRAAVDRGERSFLDLLRDNDLVLALDSLVHFGHWITPDMMPKRFDTHFYVAPAPVEQIARHDGRETTQAVWLSPGDALDQEAKGEATIIFPTRMNLRRLAMATSVRDALKRFSADDVVTVLPVVSRMADGEPCLVIPEVDGYG